MDSLSKERRSALMKKVKQASTAPEVNLRKAMHRRGLRYVISDKKLPGSPDLSFPKYSAAVFVHGCFWHGHDCRQGRPPSTNTSYWVPKLNANKERDARKEQAIRDLGWQVFTVWECELRNQGVDRISSALGSRIARRQSSTMSRSKRG